MKVSDHPLAQFRILPMAAIPDGFTVWGRGTNKLAISAPGRPCGPPKGTDTAMVSVVDYKRIAAQLIAEQEPA
jgi:hypothetical protein